MDEVADKIFDIVAKEARIDRDKLHLDATIDELQIESLDMVQIIFEIESTFDIFVPTEDENFKLQSMRDVVDGVKKLVAEKQQAAN